MSDALDRLKRKNRPKVQPRSTLVDQDIQTSRHTDIQDLEAESTEIAEVKPSRTQDIQTSRHTDSKNQESNPPKIEVLQSSANQDIKTYRHIESQVSNTYLAQSEEVDTIEVKRSTFRLEIGLIGRLHSLCRDEGIIGGCPSGTIANNKYNS